MTDLTIDDIIQGMKNIVQRTPHSPEKYIDILQRLEELQDDQMQRNQSGQQEDKINSQYTMSQILISTTQSNSYPRPAYKFHSEPLTPPPTIQKPLPKRRRLEPRITESLTPPITPTKTAIKLSNDRATKKRKTDLPPTLSILDPSTLSREEIVSSLHRGHWFNHRTHKHEEPTQFFVRLSQDNSWLVPYLDETCRSALPSRPLGGILNVESEFCGLRAKGEYREAIWIQSLSGRGDCFLTVVIGEDVGDEKRELDAIHRIWIRGLDVLIEERDEMVREEKERGPKKIEVYPS
jgi:hypothetical protein